MLVVSKNRIIMFFQIRIWGRDIDRLKQCANDIGGSNTKIFQDLETACKDADVIVTVTIATEPILKGEWLKDGAVVLGELEYYNNLIQCSCWGLQIYLERIR